MRCRPVNPAWIPPGWVPGARCASKKPRTSSTMRSERQVLCPPGAVKVLPQCRALQTSDLAPPLCCGPAQLHFPVAPGRPCVRVDQIGDGSGLHRAAVAGRTAELEREEAGGEGAMPRCVRAPLPADIRDVPEDPHHGRYAVRLPLGRSPLLRVGPQEVAAVPRPTQRVVELPPESLPTARGRWKGELSSNVLRGAEACGEE